MGKVRTFHGHEGIVPPHGLVAREAGDAPVDETTFEAEELVLPTTRSKVDEIDGFIATRREAGDVIEVDDSASKADKLAAIQAWADSLPSIGGDESDDDNQE